MLGSHSTGFAMFTEARLATYQNWNDLSGNASYGGIGLLNWT